MSIAKKVIGKLQEMSPQRITLNYGYIKEYIDDIQNNFVKAKLEKKEVGGAVFYSLTTGKGNYYFLSKNGTILYFVLYKIFNGFNNVLPNPFRQCLVWRNKSVVHASTAGFAKKVFWDILFKKYKAVISDSQQSKDGEGLWVLLIQQAFEKGYIVKIHDTNNKSFKQYSNWEEFANDRDSHYGESKFYQRYIISIEQGN
nr:MAG TPA: hypothetical protein [Caudoviricetes sp.]